MSNIIFLDIDGVLNSNFWNDIHQKEISDGTLIDEMKVSLLSSLVERGRAKIVLHSGWKYWFDKNCHPVRKEAKKLVEIFEKYAIKIFDRTPDLANDEIRQSKKFSLVKADEIKLWLREHSEITNWIVIDDLDLNDQDIAIHQIKPNQNIGLTLEDIEKGLSYLDK